MEAYYDLKEMLCKELEEVAEKGELSAGELDIVDKLTHSIKSLATIIAMEDSGYSGDSRYYTRRYDDGNSYAQKRDSMGRYSRNKYSRDEAAKDVIARLNEMMDKATSEKEKSVFREAIDHIKSL